MRFDLDSLLSPGGLALAALFLVVLVVLHGPPALLWRDDLDTRGLLGLVLCGATGLPLIVAIVGIGMEHGTVSSGVGASLIGAGMISVLVYPLLATLLVRPLPAPAGDEPDAARTGPDG